MHDVPLERELAGIPELEAFPAGERPAVLRRIAARHENPYDWQYWLWVAILVGAAIGGAWLVIRALRLMGLPGPISLGLGVVAGLAVHAFLYRAVHRWAARPALREELAQLGIAPPTT